MCFSIIWFKIKLEQFSGDQGSWTGTELASAWGKKDVIAAAIHGNWSLMKKNSIHFFYISSMDPIDLWFSLKNISTIIYSYFCSYNNFFLHQTQSQGLGTLLLGSRGLKTDNSTFSKKPYFLSFGSSTWEQ